MTAFRHCLRRSTVAFAAVWGVLLAMAGTAQAGTACPRGGDSTASCCAGRPDTCSRDCCTTQASGVSRARTDDLGVSPAQPAPRVVCNPAACECRESEPAAPGSKPEGRTPEDRSDHGGGVLPASPARMTSPAPAAFVAEYVGGRLHRPLYVLTTHLRF